VVPRGLDVSEIIKAIRLYSLKSAMLVVPVAKLEGRARETNKAQVLRVWPALSLMVREVLPRDDAAPMALAELGSRLFDYGRNVVSLKQLDDTLTHYSEAASEYAKGMMEEPSWERSRLAIREEMRENQSDDPLHRASSTSLTEEQKAAKAEAKAKAAAAAGASGGAPPPSSEEPPADDEPKSKSALKRERKAAAKAKEAEGEKASEEKKE
jgi:hypothetical protein